MKAPGPLVGQIYSRGSQARREGVQRGCQEGTLPLYTRHLADTSARCARQDHRSAIATAPNQHNSHAAHMPLTCRPCAAHLRLAPAAHSCGRIQPMIGQMLGPEFRTKFDQSWCQFSGHNCDNIGFGLTRANFVKHVVTFGHSLSKWANTAAHLVSSLRRPCPNSAISAEKSHQIRPKLAKIGRNPAIVGQGQMSGKSGQRVSSCGRKHASRK